MPTERAGLRSFLRLDRALEIMVLALAFFLISGMRADHDLWSRLRCGLDTLATGQVVRPDPFSYLTEGQTWIDHYWLSEVIIAAAFRLAGPAGLIALKLALGAGMLAVPLLSMRRAGVATPAAGALFLLAVVSLWAPLSTLRSQVFGFAAFAALISVMRSFDQGRHRAVLLVPLVLVLWVNLHGGVVAGVVVFGAWAFVHVALAFARGQRPRWELVVAGFGALAALSINPYGFALPRMLLRIGATSLEGAGTAAEGGLGSGLSEDEWEPVRFASPQGVMYLLWFAALGLALVRTRRPRSWPSVVALAVVAAAPLSAVRHLPFLAIAGPTLGADYLADLTNRNRTSEPRASWLAVVPLAMAAMLVAAALPHLGRVPIRPPYPARAVALLRAARVRANLAVDFNWGDYVIWHLGPRVRVSTDGRRETVYSHAILAENSRFKYALDGWEDLIRRPETDLVLVDPRTPCDAAMRGVTGWVPVYSDPSSTLFARSGSELATTLLSVPPPQVPFDGNGTFFPDGPPGPEGG